MFGLTRYMGEKSANTALCRRISAGRINLIERRVFGAYNFFIRVPRVISNRFRPNSLIAQWVRQRYHSLWLTFFLENVTLFWENIFCRGLFKRLKMCQTTISAHFLVTWTNCKVCTIPPKNQGKNRGIFAVMPRFLAFSTFSRKCNSLLKRYFLQRFLLKL